jgi:hypothetical protein
MIRLLIAELKLNMGLDIVDVQPHFISAKNDKGTFVFRFIDTNYYKDGDGYYIDVDKDSETNKSDFTIILFRNKRNDNVALFSTNELEYGKLSLSSVAGKIKMKWSWEITETSTT